VKPREAEHDAQVYRAYLKEWERIEKNGGSNPGVVLDFELKADIQKAIHARQKAKPDEELSAIKQQVAEQFDLKFIDSIQIPDLRIEYDLDQGAQSGIRMSKSPPIAAVNYYLGQEHPDSAPSDNCGSVPLQPELCLTPISHPPDGRTHIFDSYVSWQARPKILFGLEGDYVIQRLWRNAAPGESSAPSHVIGGDGYAQYVFTPAPL
jgi:hypothetical protein